MISVGGDNDNLQSDWVDEVRVHLGDGVRL